ncbi:MAG: UDP-glucose 4-epimerase GalE [Bacteroidetes bacterium]|nr:UDP-glucose 4-epimerase GalE [Bacteroidota bacterium]
MKNILVTGGLGYIGSHTVVALHEAGFNPIIIDNCCNSSSLFLERIAKIIGHTPLYYNLDVCDSKALNEVFNTHEIQGVIHFAAYKSVGESVSDPLKYYRNNLDSLLTLLEVLKKQTSAKLIFSSSCSLYGDAKEQPVKETTPLEKSQSPYAHTKQVCEEILTATCLSEPKLNAISLRYFNPIGAHKSGIIGEAPIGIPSNLIPFLTQSVAGIRGPLTVYGSDYDTPDGTCIRDYIHVVDLADAHVIALKRLIANLNESNYELFNIGTGKGSSVLECITTFEEVNGVKVIYTLGQRREGDVVKVWADTTKAYEVLGWKTKLDLKEMLRSAWQWQLSGI